MENLKKLVEKVLQDGFVLNLGTTDENGPWVASLVYVTDPELNLYWVSMAESRHSKALTNNPKVACTIVTDHTTDKERALQIEGTATLLSGTELEREQKIQSKRGLPIPTQAGEILTKGYQWYKLTPTRIELIHNELFGYDRQRFL